MSFSLLCGPAWGELKGYTPFQEDGKHSYGFVIQHREKSCFVRAITHHSPERPKPKIFSAGAELKASASKAKIHYQLRNQTYVSNADFSKVALPFESGYTLTHGEKIYVLSPDGNKLEWQFEFSKDYGEHYSPDFGGIEIYVKLSKEKMASIEWIRGGMPVFKAATDTVVGVIAHPRKIFAPYTPLNSFESSWFKFETLALPRARAAKRRSSLVSNLYDFPVRKKLRAHYFTGLICQEFLKVDSKKRENLPRGFNRETYGVAPMLRGISQATQSETGTKFLSLYGEENPTVGRYPSTERLLRLLVATLGRPQAVSLPSKDDQSENQSLMFMKWVSPKKQVLILRLKRGLGMHVSMRFSPKVEDLSKISTYRNRRFVRPSKKIPEIYFQWIHSTGKGVWRPKKGQKSFFGKFR